MRSWYVLPGTITVALLFLASACGDGETGWQEQVPDWLVMAVSIGFVVSFGLALGVTCWWVANGWERIRGNDEPRIPRKVVLCLWIVFLLFLAGLLTLPPWKLLR